MLFGFLLSCCYWPKVLKGPPGLGRTGLQPGRPEKYVFLWENASSVWHLVFPPLGAERGLSGSSLSLRGIFFQRVLSLRGKYPHCKKREG